MTKTVSNDDTKVVTFRLTGEELADLDEVAEIESRSRSSLLVKLARLAIARKSSDIFFATTHSQTNEIVTNN